MKTTMTLQFIIFLLLCVCFINTALAKTTIPIAIIQEELDQWLEFKTRIDIPINQIQSLDKEKSRIVANLVILNQAFHAAQADIKFDFIIAPNHKRAISMVANGNALMIGSDLFLNVLPKNLHISTAIIEEGGLTKVILGLSSNKQLMSVKTLEDLQQLSAVSLKNWKTDWSVLTSLQLNELHSVNKFKQVYDLITKRGIDFTLSDMLKSNTGSFQKDGKTMSILQGYKIKMPGSRHFVVSKVHPLGDEVSILLEQGLSILREEGKLKTYMQDIGILSKKMENWITLNE